MCVCMEEGRGGGGGEWGGGGSEDCPVNRSISDRTYLREVLL